MGDSIENRRGAIREGSGFTGVFGGIGEGLGGCTRVFASGSLYLLDN